MIGLIGCGGGGGGSSETTGTTGGDTTSSGADVSKVSNLPSVDLSDYDYSTTSSSNIAVAKGAGAGALGSTSSAYCHVRSMANEAIRMSKQVQLDKCFALAMEEGGLYALTAGQATIVKVIMPDSYEEFGGPEGGGGGPGSGGPGPQNVAVVTKGPSGEEGEEEFRSCESETGKLGGNILMKIEPNAAGDQLQISMCEGSEGSESLVNVSTFTKSAADTYTISARHCGEFCGKTDCGDFAVTLSGVQSVASGVVTLGTDGQLSATGQFSGAFGSGRIAYSSIAKSQLNEVSGSFHASFQEQGAEATDFTDAVYSRYGGSTKTGTSKHLFNGAFPAASVAELCGFGDLSGSQNLCYQDFSENLGMTVTAQNASSIKVCPQKNDDGEFLGDQLSQTGLCEESGTDTESFKIGADGETATVIADALSAFSSRVSAFDLSTISGTVGDLSFSASEWNCSGTPDVTVDPTDFASLNAAATKALKAVDTSALQTAIATCQTLEEELRNDQGIGGFNCFELEQAEFHEGEIGVDSELDDEHLAFIPEPCRGSNGAPSLSPEDCKTICDADPTSCFGGENMGMPEACIDAGETPETCPDYCEENPC